MSSLPSLTQDEDVQLHIVNAASGVIDVGSYRRHTLSSSSSSAADGVGRAVDWTELGSGVTSTDLRRLQPSPASGGPSPPPSGPPVAPIVVY